MKPSAISYYLRPDIQYLTVIIQTINQVYCKGFIASLLLLSVLYIKEHLLHLILKL